MTNYELERLKSENRVLRTKVRYKNDCIDILIGCVVIVSCFWGWC